MTAGPNRALDNLVADLRDCVLALESTGRRCLVGIAGAPASGKSTLADALTHALVAAGRQARNVPMDGFHLDNRLLDPAGLRPRKGAPETFDAAGFLHMIRRLSDEDEVVYPIFDRSQDQAIAGAGRVGPDCDIVVVEGNYLLYDAEPWRGLSDFWTMSVWIDTPEDVLRERLIQRWLDHGHDADAARARAEGNDLANARLIAQHRLPADLVLSESAALPPG